MCAEQRDSDAEWQRRFDDLGARVAADRADIDALLVRANEGNHRAHASEARAHDDRRRIDELETRVDIDRELIGELQVDGVLNREHAEQLMNALHTSRTIGAAIGIVMADRKVCEGEAFDILRRASQHANRKLRAVADEVVRTGDLSVLPKA